MKRIKHRLYGIYFLIVAVFLLLLYFLLTSVVEDRIIEDQQNNLNEEITALTNYVEEAQAGPSFNEEEITETLTEAAPLVSERMTLMDTGGEVLFDSEGLENELEPPFNPVEIQQTLDGERVGTTGQANGEDTSQYAVAQAIFDNNENPVAILQLTSNITDMAAPIQLSFQVILIAAAILAVLLILWVNGWMNQLVKALGEMKTVIGRLMESDYDARYDNHSYEEIDELGTSINALAMNLDDQQQTFEVGEERIYGLVNNLIIGVMLLDEDRTIQMVNPIMNEQLGTNLYGKISHSYTDYIRSAELIELIEQAFEQNEAANAEISLYYPEEKTFDANVVPVPGRTAGVQNYIVLLYDITEIRRLENIRTDFAANVSHELRTPITALKGFSETLLDGAMYDEEVLNEFLEIMLKESTRLDSMVQDILQLSKLEGGRTRTSAEWLEIRAVVEEVLQILQQKIELKNMTCYIEEDETISIYANHDHLKQVLMNLIANAITYTPENGTVIIDIGKEGDEVKLQVIDNGIGMPEEDQLRIFERFYRVDKARSRNSGGTGLGLSIVKWVVESMNGRIELFSEVDVGSTFIIWLPMNTQSESVYQ
jgi:two-component system phosphate regulon sensor histidine kinase PhoR